MRISAVFLAFLAIFVSSVFGFSANARNTLEYREAKEGKGDGFFEDRLDLRVNISDITVGATFEAMQPSRESALTRPDSTYNAFTQRWVRLHHDIVEITAGTFTATMGNGLLLDASERRDIQEDHHLDGANLKLKLPYLDITLLSGLAEWDAINDARIRGGEMQTKWELMPIGCGYIRYDVEAADLSDIDIAYIGETWEIRAIPTLGPVAGEVHYAKTWRETYDLDYSSYTGDIVYGTGTTSFGPLTLMGEFLMADSFIVKGYNDTLTLATLPMVVRQPSYTLVSRDLAKIDPADAIAFGGEASLSPILGSELTVSFAMLDHPDIYRDYTEVYGSIYREWESFSINSIYEFQRTGDNDPTHNVVLEPLYYLTDRTSLLLDLELQFGRDASFNQSATHLYGLAEFARSPYGAIGIEGGRLMEWDDEAGDLKPEYSGRLYIDGEIARNHKLTLAVGKRPGGFTCSGGTCRYEPAFEGIELKLSSSF